MIADFEEEDVLSRINTSGVSVSLTDEDVVSGRQALEVRVRPFHVHKNPWPRVVLGTEFIAKAVDLSTYSKIIVTIRNVTEGLPPVKLSLTSLPYNDGGRNWDDMAWYIPAGETMVCEFPTASIVRDMNDPSSIRMLMLVFPDNEIDAVYRIDAIQAVYDPAEGSPAEALMSQAKSVKKELIATERAVNWDAVPSDLRDEIQGQGPKWTREIQEILAASRAARKGGLKGQYNSHKRKLENVSRQLGKLVLADKDDFFAWEITPYLNIYRDERPNLVSPQLQCVDVRMAMDEFRDKVFMVSSCGKDLRLSVTVEPSPGLPAQAIEIRRALYFSFKNNQEELGDVLYRLEGPLEVPKDQTRQVWLTFNTHFSGLKPGRYDFSVILRDLDTGTRQSIPGTLTIWDFTLPNYDVLANNGYVQLNNCEVGQKVRGKAVEHMKRYGLNMVFVYWNYMPWPVTVDENLNIASFDTTNLEYQVRPVVEAWKAAPGNNNRLRFIFHLHDPPHNLLSDEKIAYPSEQWKQVFAKWLAMLKSTLGEWGVSADDYVFTVNDESNMSVLLNYDLPMAELIKSLDPEARITTNRGPGIRDKDTSFRFYKAFYAVLSRGDRDEQYPYIAEWIEHGNKAPELWTYKCSDMGGRTKNLYSYYRIYGWENFGYGITGPGVWTYCARAQSPWGDNKAMVGHCLIYKHKDKNDVVHSRRYEFYRQGVDDYRYLYTLRELAKEKGPGAEKAAEQLIREAIENIRADVNDTSRCDEWRIKIAEAILKLKASE